MAITVSNCDRSAFGIKLTMRLFSAEGRKSFGPGVAELLERIDRCGSLRTATSVMEMSYSKAWMLLGGCEQALGFPLIERAVGGRHGGSSRLTPQGRALLERYRLLENRMSEAAGALLDTLFCDFPPKETPDQKQGPGCAVQPIHILLTGEPGCGKSTVVQRTIEQLGIVPGGFITYFTERDQPDRTLWLAPADQSTPPRVIAQIERNRPSAIFPGVFDSFGAALLRQAREVSPLILMDECGRFEAQAQEFTGEVIRCLDTDRPVLCVVRQLGQPGWLDALAAHPRTQVIAVDASNRDDLPARLAAHFRSLSTAPAQSETPFSEPPDPPELESHSGDKN